MQQTVPRLTTALTGELHSLEKHLLIAQTQIELWFRQAWQDLPLPITSSVDIRNGGFKVAPVDTNLFPAGFNNLNRAFLPLCIQAAQSTLERFHGKCLRILLVPEDHTRNEFYLESLALIEEILAKAGYEVRLGSLRQDLTQPKTITLASGRELRFEPIIRIDNRLQVGDFSPCLIMLNNDLSEGLPALFEGITQTVSPPPSLGWYSRFKSGHFSHYDRVVTDFSQQFDLDPWLINPLFDACDDVDIARRQGEDDLADHAATLFQRIQAKYDDYEIDRKPFVVVKADSGSYGMGVMMITDPSELKQLNRKQRQRMATTKGGRKIDRVLLQEGVYSIETWGSQQAVAEPVVYLIGHHVVGGFYRVHKARGVDENLNAPGMQFEPLAFMEPCNNPDANAEPDATANRFYIYGVIARLAMLAAAREIQEVIQS